MQTAVIESKDTLKKEIDELIKKRDRLKIDIENMRTMINQETEKKVLDARKIAADVDESRKKLDADMLTLQDLALQIKKDKEWLSSEKEKVEAFRLDAKKQMEKIGSFVLTVRREAEKL